MSVHTEGHEENLLVGTQIQSLTMSGPLDGALESASCWPSLVSLCPSLCLLRATLMPILDTFAVSCDVVGMPHKELERRANVSLLRLLLCL
jgi:hypothetical protein